MGANSAIRKVAKTVLYPLTNEKFYKYIQAASKAWDIKAGNWTEPELDLIDLGLIEGETALDIGGNFGIYSYYFSKRVGKKGKVYTFEPVPFTYNSLKIVAKFLRFSHNVEIINKGCSNENTKIEFSVPIQTSGAASAGQSYIHGRDDNRDGKETQVRWEGLSNVEAEVVRLDDYLPKIDDLSFVKMDIEGAEFFCLQGAEKLFNRHLPTTICEINPWFLEGFGVNTKQLTDFFTDKGYKIFFYINDKGNEHLKQVSVDEIVEDNYLFIHPDRFERFLPLLPKEIK